MSPGFFCVCEFINSANCNISLDDKKEGLMAEKHRLDRFQGTTKFLFALQILKLLWVAGWLSSRLHPNTWLHSRKTVCEGGRKERGNIIFK